MTVTIREIREQIRSGSRSATDIVTDALSRIEKLDPALHAFNTVTAERALARAAALDRDRAFWEDAPLLGVPVALKDNLCTRGVRRRRRRACSRPTCRPMTRPWSVGSSAPAPSSWGRRTATSSRWDRPRRTPRSDPRAIRGRWTAFPADRAADPPWRWRRVCRSSRSGPTPGARFVSLRRSAGSSASSQPTAACRATACWRSPRRSIRSGRWRRRRTTRR